ncbi:CCA-adding enzyme [Listeria seeligeri]|uniref:CCA-adding enzyme n=1 Tax=Listeria seeligeri TaxID=1640 RepID=UPI0016251B34|nr:CCA-adding enzyme [Listeria seeligeri]MBC1527247.1 CCA-adding enzyme [Listeria seeligeri]MBC1942655.1 CCA-adding enzyme [Listeria seeligeri]
MAMEIKVLKNPDGTIFYPQTHWEAIRGLVLVGQDIDGIMTALDKIKLDGIEDGAEKNNVTSLDISNWNEKQDAVLVSANGTKFRILVTDNGELRTIQL